MECPADGLQEGATPVNGAFMAPQHEERGNLRGSANACMRRIDRSAPDQDIQKYGPCSHAELHSILRRHGYPMLRTTCCGAYILRACMTV